MSTILIKGARPYGEDPADILIKDGRIATVGEHLEVPGAEVADSVRSTIVEQVGNGVSVRMAVLYLLLGGAPS